MIPPGEHPEIDNYDENGVPAGCMPAGTLINIDKSRLSAEGKLALAKVCERAKLGYYLDMVHYKNSRDPAKRAELSEIIEKKYAQVEAMFAKENPDEL